MAACVERRAACGASYNACASGATPCKFETRQPARPAGKARRTVNFNGELGHKYTSLTQSATIAERDRPVAQCGFVLTGLVLLTAVLALVGVITELALF